MCIGRYQCTCAKKGGASEGVRDRELEKKG